MAECFWTFRSFSQLVEQRVGAGADSKDIASWGNIYKSVCFGGRMFLDVPFILAAVLKPCWCRRKTAYSMPRRCYRSSLKSRRLHLVPYRDITGFPTFWAMRDTANWFFWDSHWSESPSMGPNGAGATSSSEQFRPSYRTGTSLNSAWRPLHGDEHSEPGGDALLGGGESSQASCILLCGEHHTARFFATPPHSSRIQVSDRISGPGLPSRNRRPPVRYGVRCIFSPSTPLGGELMACVQ